MSTAPVLVAPFNPFPFTHQPTMPTGRRSSTPQQGRALEALGHAIEYLMDSRLYDDQEPPVDPAALHLLMVCSRAVFAECLEREPWRMRLQAVFKRRAYQAHVAAL